MRNYSIMVLILATFGLCLSACVKEHDGKPDGVIVIGNGADGLVNKAVVVEVSSARGHETMMLTATRAVPLLAASDWMAERVDVLNRSQSPWQGVSALSPSASTREVPAVLAEWFVANSASFIFSSMEPILWSGSAFKNSTELSSQTTSENSAQVCKTFAANQQAGVVSCESFSTEESPIVQAQFWNDQSLVTLSQAGTLALATADQSTVFDRNVNDLLVAPGKAVAIKKAGLWKIYSGLQESEKGSASVEQVKWLITSDRSDLYGPISDNATAVSLSIWDAGAQKPITNMQNLRINSVRSETLQSVGHRVAGIASVGGEVMGLRSTNAILEWNADQVQLVDRLSSQWDGGHFVYGGDELYMFSSQYQRARYCSKSSDSRWGCQEFDVNLDGYHSQAIESASFDAYGLIVFLDHGNTVLRAKYDTQGKDFNVLKVLIEKDLQVVKIKPVVLPDLSQN